MGKKTGLEQKNRAGVAAKLLSRKSLLSTLTQLTLWMLIFREQEVKRVSVKVELPHSENGSVMFPLWVVPPVPAGAFVLCPLTAGLCRTVAGTGPALCVSPFCARSSSLFVLLLFPALI